MVPTATPAASVIRARVPAEGLFRPFRACGGEAAVDYVLGGWRESLEPLLEEDRIDGETVKVGQAVPAEDQREVLLGPDEGVTGESPRAGREGHEEVEG